MRTRSRPPLTMRDRGRAGCLLLQCSIVLSLWGHGVTTSLLDKPAPVLCALDKSIRPLDDEAVDKGADELGSQAERAHACK